MLDQEKIKIMTRLAIYEKKQGKKDKSIMEYFRTDYISSHNFKIQLGVTFALMLIFIFHFSKIVFENISKITEYDFVDLGIRYLIIWIALMVIYTVISTINLRVEYAHTKKRIDQYNALLKKLEKIQ